MNKIYLPALLLVFITITFNLFSQEWRNQQIYELDSMTIEQSDFRFQKFNNKVDFRNTRFTSTADFMWARFDSTADFHLAIFDSTANFGYTIFDSTANFRSTQFFSIADFKRARFFSMADFESVPFASTVDFHLTIFNSTANFGYTIFDSTANFRSTQFISKADFEQAQFDSTADFSGATFFSTANFAGARFGTLADFSKAQFNSEVFFDNDILPKYLDLSYITKIANEIDLTNIKPRSDNCSINLTGTAINKIRLMYKDFKLWFPKEDSLGYELKANVYEELLAKQKEEGFTQSYEKLDKEYREFRYTDPYGKYKKNRIWGQSLNLIDKNWWDYGYNKDRVIINVVLIYLLLSLINAFMLKHLTVRVYTIERVMGLWDSLEGKSWFNKSFKIIRYSLFYTAVIFFGFSFDMEKLKVEENLKGWHGFNLIYFFIIYLGGFVCIAYLANYIITV